jgi:hypothetical protein
MDYALKPIAAAIHSNYVTAHTHWILKAASGMGLHITEKPIGIVG